MKITLETARLLLRPFNIDDASQMYDGWVSDSEVTKYVTWNPHKSIDDTLELLKIWIKQYEKPERLNFAIELKETSELIGGIDVVGYLDGIPVIGYVIARKHWNKGFATEACKALIEYLFSKGFDTIRIDAIVENIASNKVIEKCGGKYLQTVDEYFNMKDQYVRINQYIVKK